MDAGGFDKNFLAGIEKLAPFGGGERPTDNFNHGSINNKRANIWNKNV